MFSTSSRYSWPAVLCRRDSALGPGLLASLLQQFSGRHLSVVKRRPLKTSRRLADAHSGRLPHNRNLDAVIMRLFAQGSSSACRRLICQESSPSARHPAPPRPFLILQLWFCPWCLQRVTETFPLGEWPALHSLSERLRSSCCWPSEGRPRSCVRANR